MVSGTGRSNQCTVVAKPELLIQLTIVAIDVAIDVAINVLIPAVCNCSNKQIDRTEWVPLATKRNYRLAELAMDLDVIN